VFTLSWGTSKLNYSHSSFLVAQMISMLFFAVGILISAAFADKHGRGNILIIAAVCVFIFGLFFSQLFIAGHLAILIGFLSFGMFLMGISYGPLGTALAEIFPVAVRYTGTSLCFTLAGILGASLTPYLATRLANGYGLAYVGYYLSIAAVFTLAALLLARSAMKDE